MESSWAQLSTFPPDELCPCGEVLALVATYHSGWGDSLERCCPWCFGGRGVPRELNGVWLDGECRTGDDERLVELYVVAFRRSAVRREPSLDLRGHDDSLAVWDQLAMRRAWDARMVYAWGQMMRDPRLSLGDARALIPPAPWSRPAPEHVRPASRGTWQLLSSERERLSWLLRGQEQGPGRGLDDAGIRDAMSVLVAEGRSYDEALMLAVDPDEGPSLVEAGTRMAAMWAADAVGIAHRRVAYADELTTITRPVDELDVLAACCGLKQSYGTLLVLLSPSEIRALLVVWYSRALRTASAAEDPRVRFELLPGRGDVLAMAESLMAPPPD
ncbi:MAG: hypothetical protein U0R68_05890 [Candidatus Nanopelagicales bacterium]